VVLVTFEIVFTVVIISGILGVTTAYALARRDFAGKRLVVLLFLLPLLIPPLTYGIPLATVLYQLGLGGTFWGVVLINLVPSLPFVVLVMIPFIEQIDPRIEAAARVFGAGTTSLFLRILLPLLLPGMLAALLLVLVRTIAMFELTFLIAGPTSQTLVVALYYAVFAAGVRAGQSIDAMAVIYMVTTLFWLVIALQFVNPTQIVGAGQTAGWRIKRLEHVGQIEMPHSDVTKFRSGAEFFPFTDRKIDDSEEAAFIEILKDLGYFATFDKVCTKRSTS
jgi:putative spermidine/putrescine transport system permease protein